MDLYLVRHVMPDYTIIAVDNGPYVILIHTAVAYVDCVTFAAIRENDWYGLFEFKHHLSTRYKTIPQKTRQLVMTVA